MERVRLGRTNSRNMPLYDPGHKKAGGRKKGVPNKITMLLKEAIIMAAEEVGEDTKGKDGLVGYLKWMAKNEAKAYATLLGRVVPLHITGSMVHDHRVLRDKEEVLEEMKARGIPIEVIYGGDNIVDLQTAAKKIRRA